MVCNNCHAMFVRRVDTKTNEKLTCIWNRKKDGTLFEPKNTKVFLTNEAKEVVEFT